MTADASRRRATSQGTRARLLVAAQTLFVESGYEATPVRSVADRAGLTIGAFYGHFASKRVVLFEVVRAMNTVGRGGKIPFAKATERALVLTVASFADSDDEAVVVLAEVLRVIAPDERRGVNTAVAGLLLTNLLG